MSGAVTRRTVFAASAVGSIAAPHVARAAVRLVRLGHDNVPTTSFGCGSRRLAAAAAEHPDLAGVIKVEIHANATLGDELSMLDKCRANRLDMMTGATAIAVGICRDVGIFDVPFLFKDVVNGRAAFDGPLGEDYAAILKGKGINVIGWFENGMRQLTANRAVRRPDDLRGLRLRVPQSPVSVEGFNALGAKATPLAFNMVYEALRTGQVDGEETPLTGIMATKFYELQRYLCLTSHSYSVGFVVVSPGLLNDLTAKQVAALRACAMQGTLESRAVADAAAQQGVAFLRKAGMTVIDDVDTAAFAKAARPFVESLAQSLGQDRIDRLMRAAA